MALITKREAKAKLNQRFREWCQMSYGSTYNCGVNDGGLNSDWISKEEMRSMRQEWEMKTAQGYTYTTTWSTSVPGAIDFLCKDGQGSKLNFHLRQK